MATNNVIQSGHSFSMIWNKIRQGAGGMSIAQAGTEGYDNDIDAKATVSYTISWKDPVTLTAYLVKFNNGEGLDDLPHLFGLGEKTLKKSEAMIGNYNHGHTAMVGFFNPTSYHAYSKTTSSAPSVLHFLVQGFDSDVAALSRGDGNSDYRTVDHTKYMSVSNSVTDINSILSRIVKYIKDPNMKAFLQQIISGTAPHFLLNLYSFKRGHCFYKEPVDDELVNTFPSLSLTYYDALSKGYSIVTEVSSSEEKKIAPIIKKADKSTIISPICSLETYPAISFLCKVYSSDNEDYIHIRVQLENVEFKDLYLTNKPEDARKTVNTVFPTTVCRDHWNPLTFKKQGCFRFDVNCPHEDVSKKFHDLLGTDLKGVDNTRGIYTRFMGRGGGKPFWMPGGVNNGGWPAPRNSGYIGALLETNNKSLTEDYLGLQSNKHNTNLSSAHPLIKRFLTLVMTSIINKYTNPKAPTSKTGVKKWVLSDICDMLMDKKIKTQTPPAPSGSGTSTSDILTDLVVDMPETLSSTSPSSVSTGAAEIQGSSPRQKTPMPSLPTTVVGAHVRTQPQSEENLVDQLIAFVRNHTYEDLLALKSIASKTTMDGYAEKCRWVLELHNEVNSLKQR